MQAFDPACLHCVGGAGGRCTDVRGDARIDTGDVISTNGLLHDDVVAAFARA